MNEEEFINDIKVVVFLIAILLVVFVMFAISYYSTDGFTNFYHCCEKCVAPTAK